MDLITLDLGTPTLWSRPSLRWQRPRQRASPRLSAVHFLPRVSWLEGAGLWKSLSHVVEELAKSREAFGSDLGPDIVLAEDRAGIWVFHSHIAGWRGWQHRWGSGDSWRERCPFGGSIREKRVWALSELPSALLSPAGIRHPGLLVWRVLPRPVALASLVL